MTLWTFVEAQITNIEMKHDANLADISVCVPPALKKASCFISILENGVHKVIFTSEMLGTFFWCHHRLAIAVHYILLLFRLLAASKKYHFDILNK